MTDHSESAITALNHAANSKVQTVTNTAIAGGSAATASNPEVLGSYLATHYLGVLSYSEVIALIGAVWVMLQILKTIIPLIIQLKVAIMPSQPNKPVKPKKTTSTSSVKKPTKSTPKAPA
jgi:predicted lipid-binding transport protein (Tim44 family)